MRNEEKSRKNQAKGVLNDNERESIIELLQLIVEKLQKMESEIIRNKKDINELKLLYKLVSNNRQSLASNNDIVSGQEYYRMVSNEEHNQDKNDGEEPALKNEFHIFVRSSVPRLRRLSNVSSPDHADFILVDSDKVFEFNNIDRSKVIVVLTNEDNALKFAEYSIVKVDYTERQIYKVLKVLSENKSVLGDYNYGKN